MNPEQYAIYSQLLKDAGLAQDVLIQLLLPYHSFFFSAAGAIIPLTALIGIAWMAFKSLNDPNTQIGKQIFFIVLALLFITPVSVSTSSRSFNHDTQSTQPVAGSQITIESTASGTYKVSLGMSMFLAVTNSIENMLYQSSNVTEDAFSNGNSLTVLRALSMPLENYVDEPDYAKIMTHYHEACHVVPDLEANKNIEHAEWVQVGLRGNGGLGVVKGDYVDYSKELADNAGRWDRVVNWFVVRFNNDKEAFLSADRSSAVAALDSYYISASRNTPSIKGGHKVLTKKYWKTKFSNAEKVKMNALEKYEEPSNARFRISGNQNSPYEPSESVERYSWHPRTCGDLYQIAAKASTYMNEAMNETLDTESGLNGRSGSYIDADLGAGFNSMQINTIYSDYAKQHGIDYETGTLKEFGDWIKSEARSAAVGLFSWWKLDMVVTGTIALVCFAIAILFVISPAIVAFSMVPGKQGLLAFMLEAIVVMKLALYLMFFILDAGTTVLSLFMASAYDSAALGGTASLGGLMPLIQMGEMTIVIALGGVMVLSYMLVFQSSRHLATSAGNAAAATTTRTAVTGAAVGAGAARLVGASATKISRAAANFREQNGMGVGEFLKRSRTDGLGHRTASGKHIHPNARAKPPSPTVHGTVGGNTSVNPAVTSNKSSVTAASTEGTSQATLQKPKERPTRNSLGMKYNSVNK